MAVLWLILLVPLLPLGVGIWRLRQRSLSPAPDIRALASSALLCTLAFNLVFFWQELWLVLPKARVRRGKRP